MNQKIITISKKKLIWSVVVLIIILFIWGLSTLSDSIRYGSSYSVQEGVPTQDIAGGFTVSDEIYPYYNPPVDVTDTREFLKTDYSAQIYTRDVSGEVESIEDVIRRVNGRIDDISTSEKYGSISFVIKKSDLSEFRDEIEGLVHGKLYTESISSQNLLGQKQNIEQRTEDVSVLLAELEKEKDTLNKEHIQNINLLGTQINNLQNQLIEINSLKLELNQDEVEGLEYYENQEDFLRQEIVSLQQKQINTNKSYSARNDVLVSRISQMNKNLENIEEEDTQFANNIETVNGYVDVRWTSFWDMGNKFSPIPMWLNTIVLTLLILWHLKQKKILPKIRVV